MPLESVHEPTPSPSFNDKESALYHAVKVAVDKSDGVQSAMLLLENFVRQESEEWPADPGSDGERNDIPRRDGEEGNNLIHVLISLKLRAATAADMHRPVIIVNTNTCDSNTFARTAIITVSRMPKMTGMYPLLPLVTNNNAPPVRIRIVPLNLSGLRA